MTDKVRYVPEGFHSLTPYLVSNGVSRLLDFLEGAFGAKETFRIAREDGTISHASVLIHDSMLEMADPAEGSSAMTAGLHLYVKDAKEVYRRALQAGAQSLYEPRDMDYGDHEGGIEDPSGNNWYIATHLSGPHHAPRGFYSITPGLSVSGAGEFLLFLEKAFGAKIVAQQKAPNGTIGHAKVRIGDSIAECSEAHGKWGPRPVALHLYVPDVDLTYGDAIAAGAKSLSEPKDQSYGERNGGVVDAWGNHWYIATHKENVSKEEIQRRAGQAKAAG
jgi:PhnB protein